MVDNNNNNLDKDMYQQHINYLNTSKHFRKVVNDFEKQLNKYESNNSNNITEKTFLDISLYEKLKNTYSKNYTSENKSINNIYNKEDSIDYNTIKDNVKVTQNNNENINNVIKKNENDDFFFKKHKNYMYSKTEVIYNKELKLIKLENNILNYKKQNNKNLTTRSIEKMFNKYKDHICDDDLKNIATLINKKKITIGSFGIVTLIGLSMIDSCYKYFNSKNKIIFFTSTLLWISFNYALVKYVINKYVANRYTNILEKNLDTLQNAILINRCKPLF